MTVRRVRLYECPEHGLTSAATQMTPDPEGSHACSWCWDLGKTMVPVSPVEAVVLPGPGEPDALLLAARLVGYHDHDVLADLDSVGVDEVLLETGIDPDAHASYIEEAAVLALLHLAAEAPGRAGPAANTAQKSQSSPQPSTHSTPTETESSDA